MIVYNTTISVEEDIEQDWLRWIKGEHIPEIMATGFFVSHKLLKLLNEQPDATGVTYAVQYEVNSISELDEYLSAYAPIFQQKQIERFGQKCLAFQTVLEEV